MVSVRGAGSPAGDVGVIADQLQRIVTEPGGNVSEPVPASGA